MKIKNKNSTNNLLEILDKDWDDEEYFKLMRIEDILENRKKLKIIKKYWKNIFNKAKQEFNWWMHWSIAEVNATPPKPLPKYKRNWWTNDFRPQESENVKWLILIYDSHFDSYCDSCHWTIYIKTKKWYFSVYFRD